MNRIPAVWRLLPAIGLLASLTLAAGRLSLSRGEGSLSPATSAVVGPNAESWRLGTVFDGTAPLSALPGRAVSSAIVVQSNRTTDTYFVFPPVASAIRVRSASVYLLGRTGSSGANALLALEALNVDGSVQRTLSASTLDLEAAALGAWLSLSLVADTSVDPAQRVAFHIQLNNAGSLDVRPLFEVTVAPATNYLFLPIIKR